MKKTIFTIIGIFTLSFLFAQTNKEEQEYKEQEKAGFEKYKEDEEKAFQRYLEEQEAYEQYIKEKEAELQKYIDQDDKNMVAFLRGEIDWEKITLKPIDPRTALAVDFEKAKQDNIVNILRDETTNTDIPEDKIIETKPEETEKPKEVNIPDEITRPEPVKPKFSFTPSGKPVPDKVYRISSKFGPRVHPIHKTKRMHKGIDIASPKGTEIYATADGIVISAGKVRGYGNYILIKHGDTYRTAYAHLDKIKIKKGDVIMKGDLIGTVGSTGWSTGPHLHFEVLKDKKHVNPEDYI